MLRLALLLPVIWILKSLAYWGIFKFRTISATGMHCLLIGGAPVILMGIPIGLPSFLMIPGSLALAVYLTMHYTGEEFFPNGVLIPLGVEALFAMAGLLILGSPFPPYSF